MRKPRIAISQRRDDIINRNEIREGVDTRLTKFIWSIGFTPIPLCSECLNLSGYLEDLEPDGFVLSGGNNIGTSYQRDFLEEQVLIYSKKNNVPVIGICRGMQFINHFQGGKLNQIENHVSTRHEIFGPLIPKNSREVNSFHEFALTEKDIGKDLISIAWSNDHIIEAFKHKLFPWIGIMWHPEREEFISKDDENLFFNHFKRKS